MSQFIRDSSCSEGSSVRWVKLSSSFTIDPTTSWVLKSLDMFLTVLFGDTNPPELEEEGSLISTGSCFTVFESNFDFLESVLPCLLLVARPGFEATVEAVFAGLEAAALTLWTRLLVLEADLGISPNTDGTLLSI